MPFIVKFQTLSIQPQAIDTMNIIIFFRILKKDHIKTSLSRDSYQSFGYSIIIYLPRMINKILFAFFIICIASAADWTRVNDLFLQAIQERVFPGAVLAVANETAVIYRKAYGYLTYGYQLHDVEVTMDTKYDVASVTKMMATAFTMMSLVGSNLIKLDDPVTKYVKNYDVNKKGNTTIGNLMLHNSGLPYDYPGPLPRTTQEVNDWITFAKPDFPVGSKFQYSNLGLLLASQIVANISRKTFSQCFDQIKIFAGLPNSGFNPPVSQYYKIAPCQYDSQVRKRIVRGEAHQRLAYFFGGVGGHSGIFTTADDLVRFMRILLNKGKIPGEPTRVLSESAINLFTTRVEGLPYDNKRGYGFDTNCHGTKMKNCFGHDGSTGVMAWADKDKKIVFAILSNRGHPDAKNNKFNQFYAKISDAIFQALGY